MLHEELHGVRILPGLLLLHSMQIVSDGCAWIGGYCIELATSCDGTLWSATEGVAPDTVIFSVKNSSHADAIGLCADFNSGLALLEVCGIMKYKESSSLL